MESHFLLVILIKNLTRNKSKIIDNKQKLLQQCINREETEENLVYEKCQAAIRELERYLKMQGFSAIDIKQFMKSNNASIKIRYNSELWKLRRRPEKLMKEVQDSK
jgi:DNA-binding protein H-NS